MQRARVSRQSARCGRKGRGGKSPADCRRAGRLRRMVPRSLRQHSFSQGDAPRGAQQAIDANQRRRSWLVRRTRFSVSAPVATFFPVNVITFFPRFFCCKFLPQTPKHSIEAAFISARRQAPGVETLTRLPQAVRAPGSGCHCGGRRDRARPVDVAENPRFGLTPVSSDVRLPGAR